MNPENNNNGKAATAATAIIAIADGGNSSKARPQEARLAAADVEKQMIKMFDHQPKKNAEKEIPIGINARKVIDKRYARKSADGVSQEDWREIVERTVCAVAMAETTPEKRSEFADQLKPLMLKREFVPNTPCLVNAGKPGGQLSACFVLPIEDSIEGIMKHAQSVAKIHQTGGGTGQSYERIRPAGAVVNSTMGVASGPVSFMNIVNTATEVVKQGGVRRGANMGILRVNHPDVLRFIHAKNDQTSLTNFNISVTVTDEFMEAVENSEWYQLEFGGEPWTSPVFDPVTGDDYKTFYDEDSDLISFIDRADYEARKDEIVGIFDPFEDNLKGQVFAPDIWNRIIGSAHKYAEPGIIFIDEVNRHNYLKNTLGEIISCNPCAEQNLHANNACTLGSIDVSKFFDKTYQLNWKKLREAVRWSVRFLDNVIDVCAYPLPEIAETVRRTRPIGLGVMGFADLCLKLEIRYGSEDSRRLMENLMKFFRRTAWEASLALGREKGAFAEFEGNRSLYGKFFAEIFGDKPNGFAPRNYEVTTVAPCGTISLVAETSSGIEPNFSWAYFRRDSVGERFYVHPLAAEALGIQVDQTDEESVKEAARKVGEKLDLLPDYFVAAEDLTAEEHVRLLAAAQKHVDNSISKTCNGAKTDTVEDVDRLYRLARSLGCKAVSYYRDGSREGQVLTAIDSDSKNSETSETSDSGSAQVETSEQSSVKHGKIKREIELTGSTWKFDFSDNNLYVTVNHNGEKAVEVFVAGQISNGVGVLASTMLQSDCFTAAEVARKLDKITGINSVWFNERLLTSPEQAVAECLRIVTRRLENIPEGSRSSRRRSSVTAMASGNGLTDEKNQINRSRFKTCPDCKSEELVLVAGCPTCQACGYSKCS